jgi:hypothetical protein
MEYGVGGAGAFRLYRGEFVGEAIDIADGK